MGPTLALGLRPCARWLSVLAVAATSLTAQGERVAPSTERRAPDHLAGDFHRLHDRPSPREVMSWLQAARTRAAPAERPRVGGVAPPVAPTAAPPRPSGAGRWVAAVVVDAEVDVDPHAILGVPRADLLVLASPGPCVRPEELAALERAVREERLALCVVMVREGETSPSADADTAAARALRRRLQEARTGAERAGMSAAAWHAILQASVVTSSSDELQRAARAGTFQAALAVLPGKGAGLRWVAPWFDKPLPTEVLADRAATERSEPGAAARSSEAARPRLPPPPAPGDRR